MDAALGTQAGRATAAASLVLTGVTRSHDGRPVWAPLDLRLDAGTLTVLTGPNGAGKTTLLRVAAGLLPPSSGQRHCPGRALYVRGGGGLRSALTVRDAITTTAALAGRGAQAQGWLERLELTRLADRRVGTLSAGERVRASLAAVAATQPALLCLDEPTSALDPDGLTVLTEVLLGLRATGTTLVVATHQPEGLLGRADAHLHVADGRVVAA